MIREKTEKKYQTKKKKKDLYHSLVYINRSDWQRHMHKTE
jgi:hypothetical protein